MYLNFLFIAQGEQLLQKSNNSKKLFKSYNICKDVNAKLDILKIQ